MSRDLVLRKWYTDWMRSAKLANQRKVHLCSHVILEALNCNQSRIQDFSDETGAQPQRKGAQPIIWPISPRFSSVQNVWSTLFAVWSLQRNDRKLVQRAGIKETL